MKKTLSEWILELQDRFDERELKYMSVHKAMIQIQLKDAETGQIELHNLEYKAKEAVDLTIERSITNDEKNTFQR